jgi:hypothetical protein
MADVEKSLKPLKPNLDPRGVTVEANLLHGSVVVPPLLPHTPYSATTSLGHR